MIYNMDQMHVDSVTIKGHERVEKGKTMSSTLSHFLRNNSSLRFSYSYSYNDDGGVDVTYEIL